MTPRIAVAGLLLLACSSSGAPPGIAVPEVVEEIDAGAGGSSSSTGGSPEDAGRARFAGEGGEGGVAPETPDAGSGGAGTGGTDGGRADAGSVSADVGAPEQVDPADWTCRTWTANFPDGGAGTGCTCWSVPGQSGDGTRCAADFPCCVAQQLATEKTCGCMTREILDGLTCDDAIRIQNEHRQSGEEPATRVSRCPG